MVCTIWIHNFTIFFLRSLRSTTWFDHELVELTKKYVRYRDGGELQHEICIKKRWSIPLRNCESFIRFRAPSLLKGWNFLVNSTIYYKKVRRRFFFLLETSSSCSKTKSTQKRVALIFYASASMQRWLPSKLISKSSLISGNLFLSFPACLRDRTTSSTVGTVDEARSYANSSRKIRATQRERARFTRATWLEVNGRLLCIQNGSWYVDRVLKERRPNRR